MIKGGQLSCMWCMRGNLKVLLNNTEYGLMGFKQLRHRKCQKAINEFSYHVPQTRSSTFGSVIIMALNFTFLVINSMLLLRFAHCSCCRILGQITAECRCCICSFIFNICLGESLTVSLFFRSNFKLPHFFFSKLRVKIFDMLIFMLKYEKRVMEKDQGRCRLRGHHAE